MAEVILAVIRFIHRLKHWTDRFTCHLHDHNPGKITGVLGSEGRYSVDSGCGFRILIHVIMPNLIQPGEEGRADVVYGSRLRGGRPAPCFLAHDRQ